MKGASVLIFIVGSFLIGWGWWDAHYGDRPVWKGMAVVFAGFCLGVFAVVAFISC